MEFGTMPRIVDKETLSKFVPIADANRARRGKIGICEYVAKCSWGEGLNQDDYVHNECVCDELLRSAGVPVPPSREYKVDFGRGIESVRLMACVLRHPNCADMPPWDEDDQKLLARRYYALMAFVGKTRVFEKPNVAYDSYENIYFVNNSHSLKYAALGELRENWNSIDPHDTSFGAGAIVGDEKNEPTLCRILRYCTTTTLKNDAQGLDFEMLVKKLPKEYSSALAAMASDWNVWKCDGLDLDLQRSLPGRMPWTQAVLAGKDIMTTEHPLAEVFLFEATAMVPYLWASIYNVVEDWTTGLRVYCEKQHAIASGRPFRVMKGADIISAVRNDEYRGRLSLQNTSGEWLPIAKHELDDLLWQVKRNFNAINEPLPENKPPSTFKKYEGFVKATFDEDRKGGGIAFETEDEYQFVHIRPADEKSGAESVCADPTPFVNANALSCSFSAAYLYSGWATGWGRSIFTFELQDIRDQVMCLLDKNGSSKTAIFLNTLMKEVFIYKINSESFKFTIVDNGEECPMATHQIISRGELWKIHNFFEACVTMFPVVGLPSPDEKILSNSATLRMLRHQANNLNTEVKEK